VAELRSEEFQTRSTGLQNKSNATPRDPVPSLKAALRCRTGPETQLIFKAIQWVGFAFRLLAVDELLHALNTTTDFWPEQQDAEVAPANIQTGEQLMELCFGLLEINDAELVDFTNANLRTLVLSQNFPGTGAFDGGSGHEMLAMVCIKNLHCLDRQTLLKPWISTTQWVLDVRQECPLRGYATSFWDAHSRVAQSNCKYLPALLHQAILGALPKEDKSDPFYMPTTRGRTDVALWLCSFYGFKPLVKTYLEMGGDPNARTFWPGTPLHAAVANADLETALLLLDRGGNPDSQNVKGLTSFDIAHANGNEQMARLLNQREINVKYTLADATLFRHCLYSNCHSPQEIPDLGLSDPGMFIVECENGYNKRYSPDEEPRDSGEAVAATAQRLESLALQPADSSNSSHSVGEKSHRTASAEHEGWTIVERDDTDMDCS
jgi:hypothetical protein